MGLACDIAPGGLFPLVPPSAELTLEELSAVEKCLGNHPSFNELHGQERAPGVELLQDHLNAGYGRLFTDVESAERALGVQVFPAPMGNIAKVRS